MTILKIIEGQEEKDLMSYIDKEYPNVERWKYEHYVKYCYNWHKQSIIQILESEIERKRGMKKEEYYCCAIHGSIDGVLCECIGETFGYNQAIQEDIAHMTVLLNSLK